MAQTKVKRELIDGSLGTDWQSAPKTSNFTAVAGEGYFVDTTSSIVTVSLPVGSAGDEIHFTDYASNFNTNGITFSPSSSPSQQKIQGRSTDAKNITQNAYIKLVYQNDTKGWTADNLTDNPPSVALHYLVVAGGGGTSTDSPGGGGAGGLRTSWPGGSGGGAGSENQITANVGVDYTISVGPGGGAASNGTDSVFSGNDVNGTAFNITSKGGGTGSGATASYNAGTGGSGGGGSGGDYGDPGGAGEPNQGFAGGTSPGSGSNATYPGGGGGGAAGVGVSPSQGAAGGNGGPGKEVNIIGGTGNYYAGGGGGTSGGAQGQGHSGGGNGGSGANNGTTNTGSGGGGTSASGGSGVVILRYPNNFSISETTNPAVLNFNTGQDGSDKVTTFTSGTSGTIRFS